MQKHNNYSTVFRAMSGDGALSMLCVFYESINFLQREENVNIIIFLVLEKFYLFKFENSIIQLRLCSRKIKIPIVFFFNSKERSQTTSLHRRFNLFVLTDNGWVFCLLNFSTRRTRVGNL